MAYHKRKAQHNDSSHENKNSRQPSSGFRNQNSTCKQLNQRSSEVFAQQPHCSQPNENQLRCSPQPDSLMENTSFGQLHRESQRELSQSPGSTVESSILEQEELHGKVQIAPSTKWDPFVPYSDSTIPILWSDQIDHSIDLSLQLDQWESSTWSDYYEAFTVFKAGLNRQSFGLPAASREAGSLLNVACVDLYYNVLDKGIYVASETGLITVPDYLMLCDIDLTRRVRFTGTTPAWVKMLSEKVEKRYVTEIFDGEPLDVRSEVLVFDTFYSPEEPVGLWGRMFSVAAKKTVKFPLKYTAKERPSVLFAVELKQVLGLRPKKPTPQELGEALFKQAEEFDRGELDLNMTKTLDEYLKECGYLYGEFAPENTQQKRGIFFESLDSTEDLDSTSLHGDSDPSLENTGSVTTDSRNTPSLFDADNFDNTYFGKDVQKRSEAAKKQGNRSSAISSRNSNTPTPDLSTKNSSRFIHMVSKRETGTETKGSGSANLVTDEGPADKVPQKRAIPLENSVIGGRQDKDTPNPIDHVVGVASVQEPDMGEQSSHGSPAPPPKRTRPTRPPPSIKKAKMIVATELNNPRAAMPIDKNPHKDGCEDGSSNNDDSTVSVSAKHDMSMRSRADSEVSTDSPKEHFAPVPCPKPSETQATGTYASVTVDKASSDDEFDIEIPTYEMLLEEMNRRYKC